MKASYFDQERSEEKLSIDDFLKYYNADLPSGFPRASKSSLREFREAFPSMFKGENSWSLIQHRKKFMDWPPQRAKTSLDNA